MKRIVLIGAGGIGAPCALALGAAGVGELVLVDDDHVETSNLHRQVLFGAQDVGRPKLEAMRDALSLRFPAMHVELRPGRAAAATVRDVLADAALVVDATDNFASRFLLADAAYLAGIPVVHAAAVRLTATVCAFAPEGAPCYRCLFEDLPSGDAPDCATAGVLGPVCGVAGALAADLALRWLAGDASFAGTLVTYAAGADRLRGLRVHRRSDCALCGDRPSIGSIDPERYRTPACSSEVLP